MVKMGFSTQAKDGWPPFEAEHIWLEPVGSTYLVKNTPFYVRGISYGDEIEISSRDGIHVDSWNLSQSSGNSTVWIMELEKGALKKIVEQLESIGCMVENGAPEGYFSINIPRDVSMDQFDIAIEQSASRKDFSVAYATLRHVE